MNSFAERIAASGGYLLKFNGNEYPACFREFEEMCAPYFSALEPGGPAGAAEDLVAALAAQLEALPKRERKAAAERLQRLLALYVTPAAARHSELAGAFAVELQERWNRSFPKNRFLCGDYEKIMEGFNATFLGIPLKDYRRR